MTNDDDSDAIWATLPTAKSDSVLLVGFRPIFGLLWSVDYEVIYLKHWYERPTERTET